MDNFFNKFFKVLTTKKFISAMIMVLALVLFLIGFYMIGPQFKIKGYIVVFGLIMTVYGFINILT